MLIFKMIIDFPQHGIANHLLGRGRLQKKYFFLNLFFFYGIFVETKVIGRLFFQ